MDDLSGQLSAMRLGADQEGQQLRAVRAELASKDWVIAEQQEDLEKARQGLQKAIQDQQISNATAATGAASIGGGGGYLAAATAAAAAARVMQLEQELSQSKQAGESQKQILRQVGSCSLLLATCSLLLAACPLILAPCCVFLAACYLLLAALTACCSDLTALLLSVRRTRVSAS